MKTKKLQTTGFQEMSEAELRDVDGGWIWQSIAFAIAWDLLNDTQGCMVSMKEGWVAAR